MRRVASADAGIWVQYPRGTSIITVNAVRTLQCVITSIPASIVMLRLTDCLFVVLPPINSTPTRTLSCLHWRQFKDATHLRQHQISTALRLECPSFCLNIWCSQVAINWREAGATILPSTPTSRHFHRQRHVTVHFNFTALFAPPSFPLSTPTSFHFPFTVISTFYSNFNPLCIQSHATLYPRSAGCFGYGWYCAKNPACCLGQPCLQSQLSWPCSLSSLLQG